ncbi:hypothetical protein PY310_19885 [Pseudarthrobacter sp. H3Y2-7]|uniref:hypothetical protein n=1 Tax=Pseudarthrobacter naphthalenicus TaxID=3031328 RepID=UPI0023B04290|nr:hypothetical protein [Pseudarthrobacter sp. H3Y2-7]MDE8670836.1 hypothetical protein [Pseudarthrobacter sp. H3Y2-7]
MNGALRDRAAQVSENFRSWVDGLNLPDDQVRVLSELLGMMDAREFVEGRAACVTYEAEVARLTGLGDSLNAVVADLVSAGLLTSHPASDVFPDRRPGVVFRVRRPDVVLTVEAAGPLWMADSWVRRRSAVRSAS